MHKRERTLGGANRIEGVILYYYLTPPYYYYYYYYYYYHIAISKEKKNVTHITKH